MGMTIRRNTQEYGLPAGIIEIELTAEEVEQAFRLKEREYLLADVENAVDEAYGREDITEEQYQKAKGNQEAIKAIADYFDKTTSCEIAYNVTMEEAVKHILKGGA